MFGTRKHGLDYPKSQEPAGWVVVAAAFAMIVATPVTIWWLVGDLSEPVADPDYMVRPIPIGSGVQQLLGLGALLVVLAAASVLARLFWTRLLDRKWLPPVIFLAAAGVVIGAGWRVVTAGVIGANIGGGLVVLLGGPLIIGLVVGAVVTACLRPVRPEGRPDRVACGR